MSESPFNQVAPALANALRAATGIRLTPLPLARDRIYLALKTASRVPTVGAELLLARQKSLLGRQGISCPPPSLWQGIRALGNPYRGEYLTDWESCLCQLAGKGSCSIRQPKESGGSKWGSM